MGEQSRNHIYALERDLYNGQFCSTNDFQFEDSEAYLGRLSSGPAVMREMTNVPDVAFTGVRGSTSTTYNKSKLNANRYATKKTIAQGMLDIALLASNASQLKYVLTVGEEHDYYLPMIILIISSIVLQVYKIVS